MFFISWHLFYVLNILSDGFHLSKPCSLFDSGRASERIRIFSEVTTAGKGFFLEENENENLNAFAHPGNSGRASPLLAPTSNSCFCLIFLKQYEASCCPDYWVTFPWTSHTRAVNRTPLTAPGFQLCSLSRAWLQCSQLGAALGLSNGP